MAPKIIDKEEKKKQIVQAAMQVFSKNGIAKSKMIDIAKAAGIGKGTIYEYFRSKEEIFSSAFHSMFGEMEIMISEGLVNITDPIKKLEFIIGITLDYHRDDAGEFAGIMMDFWAEGIRTKNEHAVQTIDLKQIYQQYRILLSQIVHEGIEKGVFKYVDANAFSAITMGALDGLFLQIIMDPKVINIDEVKKTFTDTLLAGLLTKT
ncbi:MAG: TetR/AcrR family transcriptional regulator [Calditrichaeota bacterium]|nr:MAG: TetR/AcrR family transcriptional regulator [Calditrichota bacterium]MBL1206807.1 TetR/AcrR family transcriptional regulator [Calditrichota bacterium]NOG46635.1 TetR/AcrR family transcriptional regulator [Calditrichota bacterium]